MKLQVVYIISILAFANGQMAAEDEIDQGKRFLADRAVTASELATHKTYAARLWTSLNGIVYDISNFKHPGGSVILSVGGKQGDTLYQKGVNSRVHPFTKAQVVSQPGIVRIGPLTNGPAPTRKPVTGSVPSPKPPTKKPITAPGNKSPTRVPARRPTRRPIARSPVKNENESPEDGFD